MRTRCIQFWLGFFSFQITLGWSYYTLRTVDNYPWYKKFHFRITEEED